MNADNADLVHRDDLDPELLEKLKQMFPGMAIICAGDVPQGELSDKMKQDVAVLNAKHEQSMRDGTCLDCGISMPNYHPIADGWEPFEGWVWFEDRRDCIVAWQCPECDKNEKRIEI